MELSIIIPAYNEESIISQTINNIQSELNKHRISHEILVVAGRGSDKTEEIVVDLSQIDPSIVFVKENPNTGFGRAVQQGIEHSKGKAVAIMMADGSDSPQDLVKFYKKMLDGYDCVFGTRFEQDGKVVGYPKQKLFLNRVFNLFLQILFLSSYNDFTNAFKLYSRECLNDLVPFFSRHFNFTIELPLKALVRGHKIAVLGNHWENRRENEISNLRVGSMGRRYLYTALVCFLEKVLVRDDYHKGEKK